MTQLGERSKLLNEIRSDRNQSNSIAFQVFSEERRVVLSKNRRKRNGKQKRAWMILQIRMMDCESNRKVENEAC